MTEIEKAIEFLKYDVMGFALDETKDNKPTKLHLVNLAIKALKEMQEREQMKCEYCKSHGKPSFVVWDTNTIKQMGEDKPKKAFIKITLSHRINEAALIVKSQSENNTVNQLMVDINYCPMCGRKIRTEEKNNEL